MGAWSSRLLPHLASRLAARRQAVVYPTIPQQWRQQWSQAPIIVDMGTPSGEWVAPPLAGLDLKFAASIHGRLESEGSDLMFAPDADEGETILAHFRPHLRDWHGYVPVRVKVGFYAMSHDGSVVVERLGPGNIWIGTGCCGQGFKFAPVMASVLARCVAEESEPETVLSAFGFSQAPPPTAEFHASRLAG
jgi:glycine/D-amino acid oxidase-like deaminating enzyme